MMFFIELLATIALFLVGIRLSAFFSGAETGFYRVSFPRLSLEAQAGNARARRVLWFARNPAYFVATTLVGNNVANYVTTFAIATTAILLMGEEAAATEVVATVLLAPVVFLFGELLPKNLSYRAPMQMLGKQISLFRVFYWLFLPVSFPLVGLTRLLERVARSEQQPMELLLGRKRFAQLITHGKREGVLNNTQSQLAAGILENAGQPVRDSVMPSERVPGLPDTATREEILTHAAAYGLTQVPVHKADDPRRWHGAVRVADLIVADESAQPLVLPIPTINSSVTKLEALRRLLSARSNYGVVRSGNHILGLVVAGGLTEQMFRPARLIRREFE